MLKFADVQTMFANVGHNLVKLSKGYAIDGLKFPNLDSAVAWLAEESAREMVVIADSQKRHNACLVSPTVATVANAHKSESVIPYALAFRISPKSLAKLAASDSPAHMPIANAYVRLRDRGVLPQYA